VKLVHTQLFGGPLDGEWISVPDMGPCVEVPLIQQLLPDADVFQVDTEPDEDGPPEDELYVCRRVVYRWERRQKGPLRWRVLVYEDCKKGTLAKTWPL
jgi:hypothetical protein